MKMSRNKPSYAIIIPSPQAILMVSMSFTVCAIRSPIFLLLKKSKSRLCRWAKNSFLKDCSSFLDAPIRKYLHPNLKIDMSAAIMSI